MTPGDFFAESHLTRPTRRVALDSFIFIVALKCPETLKSSAAVDNPKERLKRVAVDSPRVALDCVSVRGGGANRSLFVTFTFKPYHEY